MMSFARPFTASNTSEERRVDYELTHETKGNALVVHAKGKFDRNAGGEVQTLLDAHQGVRVLSMNEVSYISSSGIAALVKLSAQKQLRLAAVPQNILHTLSLAGIEKILSIHDDEAKARHADG